MRSGSWLPISITAAMPDGPATSGIAIGTMKGSPSGQLAHQAFGRREDHAQADQEQHDAAGDRHRFLAQVHQLQRVAGRPTGTPSARPSAISSSRTSTTRCALRRQRSQQAEEHRDVAERIEDQEQQQRGRGDGHERRPVRRERRQIVRARWRRPRGDSKVDAGVGVAAGIARDAVVVLDEGLSHARPVRIGPGCSPLTRTGPLASSACSIADQRGEAVLGDAVAAPERLPRCCRIVEREHDRGIVRLRAAAAGRPASATTAR